MVIRSARIAAAIALAAGFLAVSAVEAAQPVNAVTAAEHMDKEKYSPAEIKSYLKGLKNQTVTAQGKVNDILTGKTGNRVVVFVNTPKSRDFVVDVYVDSASGLKKGDLVSCSGKYAKYNIFTVNGITLKDGSCSKK